MAYVWQTWLADALRDEGCDVREYQGWKSRGRPSSSGSFDPYAVLVHHTGTKTSKSNPCPTLTTCVNGRSDLPGPLCQVVIGYDGVCHVIAAGRANHGGECNGDGPTSSGDANAQMIGIEVDYSGSQDVSQVQADATVRASAAILRRKGKDASYCRGHKETSTTGKWDPGKDGSSDPDYRMDEVRGYIRDRLAGGGEDEDMTYASFGGPGITVPADGSWRTVKYDDVRADPDGILNPGFGALHVGKCNLTAMVALGSISHDEHATLLVRWTEHEDDGDELVSASTPHEYVLPSGGADLRDTNVDAVSAGHYVKTQVMAQGGGVTIGGVAVKVIYWPK